MFGAAESKSTDFAETPRGHREPQYARMLTASMPRCYGEQRGAEINKGQMNTVQLCGMSIVEWPGDAEGCFAQGDQDCAALVHDCMAYSCI